jgi:cyclopropane-fatty-acyl-phospholipid synthase
MTIASRFVLKALERLSVGRITIHLPDGTAHRFGREGARPEAELHVRDWRFFRRVVLDGDIGFAEAYIEGLCDSPDLAGLIALLAENEKSLGRMAHTNALHDLALKFLHWQRRNSRRGSRKNIHAHYDLGNEFYRL